MDRAFLHRASQGAAWHAPCSVHVTPQMTPVCALITHMHGISCDTERGILNFVGGYCVHCGHLYQMDSSPLLDKLIGGFLA